MTSQRSSLLWPVASLLLGASLWGLSWYPLRLLESYGLNGIWLSFILYTAALAGSAPRIAQVLRDFFQNPRLMGILLFAGGWTNIAFVLAILKGNILRVLLLFYLSPLWATLLGWFFLSERPSRQGILSLILVMSGALLMLQDPGAGFPWPQTPADWLAISSGFAFAVSNVTVRSAGHLSLATKSIGVFIGVSLLAGVMLLFSGGSLPQTSFPVVLGGVLLGLFGILGMTILVQYGVTHMPVHRSSVILLFELVVGAVSQQLLTDEIVAMREGIGGVLIIFGAYLAANHSDQNVTDKSRK